MPQVPINDVKKMIDIENAIIELKKNNMQIKRSNYTEIINIIVDFCGDLNVKEMEYANIALKLPFDEIEKLYEAYLTKKDKINESQLIDYIIDKYDVDKFFVAKRIDQIKKIKSVERLELYNKVNREEQNKGGKRK